MQKPLGVHIDYKLKFDTHIETLCSKVGKKLHACPCSIDNVHVCRPSINANEKFYIPIQLLSTHLDVS